MEEKPRSKLLATEDYWAIWLGLFILVLAMGFFWGGATLAPWAVTPGTWKTGGELVADLGKHAAGYLVLYLGFGAVFTLSMAFMRRNLGQYVAGYTVLFLGSLAIFYLAGWKVMHDLDLGAPLLALLLGLVIGNLARMPPWIQTALRTEYYVKTGIVLLGATLPVSLIFTTGPLALLQATIVSVSTWLTIYLAATRLFKLDPRFGAVLGAGGAVCGVSGSIAIGGAVRADKDHIAIGIGVVSVWAIVMIFLLTFVLKAIVPDPMHPAVAGAWVGTSEYADAAGFAVVAELAQKFGEGPIQAFTLMKVIGRDIWIGIWAFVLSVVSVVYWEKREGGARLGAGVIWERFPKFVIGFFVASMALAAVGASAPADWDGVAPVKGAYKSKVGTEKYDADFSAYVVPGALADRFSVDREKGQVRFRGKMSREDFTALTAAATTPDQKTALKQLRDASNWVESVLGPKVVGPIKKLREWAFVLCFLGIGLSTRFKDLATFGLKPFWAFTIGVLVNVPLGFLLSQVIFRKFWMALQ